MPRQARIDTPGVLRHIIICRGIEQRDIFHDDADRKNFVDRLGDVRIMKTNKANASFQT